MLLITKSFDRAIEYIRACTVHVGKQLRQAEEQLTRGRCGWRARSSCLAPYRATGALTCSAARVSFQRRKSEKKKRKEKIFPFIIS